MERSNFINFIEKPWDDTVNKVKTIDSFLKELTNLENEIVTNPLAYFELEDGPYKGGTFYIISIYTDLDKDIEGFNEDYKDENGNPIGISQMVFNFKNEDITAYTINNEIMVRKGGEVKLLTTEKESNIDIKNIVNEINKNLDATINERGKILDTYFLMEDHLEVQKAILNDDVIRVVINTDMSKGNFIVPEDEYVITGLYTHFMDEKMSGIEKDGELDALLSKKDMLTDKIYLDIFNNPKASIFKKPVKTTKEIVNINGVDKEKKIAHVKVRSLYEDFEKIFTEVFE